MFHWFQGKNKRRPSGKRGSFFKPFLEVLEDRRLLSADYVTTQVTLEGAYNPSGSPVSALVSASSPQTSGESYTVAAGNSSTPGTAVYTTGAVWLKAYTIYPGGTGGSLGSSTYGLVATYALQGQQIPPNAGATFSAEFPLGITAIYAVPVSFLGQDPISSTDPTTWGPLTSGSILLYSATVGAPDATITGPNGDQTFTGQPASSQNQANFNTASGTQTDGALAVLTDYNQDALFSPPMNFNGFQAIVKETNSLTNAPGSYPSTYPSNAALDSNFDALAALSGAPDLSSNPFGSNDYTQNANVAGPDTAQQINIALYPFQAPTTTPTINTTQQPATAVVGTPIADQATVTGNNPTGTVTFNLYNNNSASGTPLFTDTEPLVNGVATSASYTTTATGTDYWVDTYNGDANNSSVTSGVTAEPVTITPTTPGINTSQQPASAVVGSSIADKATVTGLVNASSGDTVTFNLYSSATTQNSSTLLFSDTETVSLSGSTATATSAGYTTTATGTDYWVATFNGDSNNSAVTSGSTAEPVAITPTTPGINTSQQPATAVVGSSVADKATVTGLVSASSSDTVTFNLYSSATTQNASTLLFSDTETVSLSGSTATATSAGYTATATGTDYWVATFNGDSNNSSVTSGATAEPVTITPTTPAINTSQQPASAVVGSSIADKATVTGLVNASSSDTVTFNLYSSPTTQNASTLLFSNTQTVSISGSTATATSAGYTTTATGTDYWVATFNGDSNNSSVTSGATAEPVTITPTTPGITTSQQPATAVVGSSVADKATVTGLVSASSSDTVTFNLYSSATTQNSSTLLFTDTETVSLSGSTATATSKGYTTTATGTDYWVATFNGDSNNSAVTSGATAEPVTITPTTPAINTSPFVITTTGPGGQYATIGFWHNKNGQAVITNFDTGANSTKLGNSLASNYANLFGYANPYTSATLGAAAGTAPGLAGLTNSQVAAVYLGLWTPSGLQKNTYVQAFAVALGAYASGGAGTFNVGSNGAAFGVANNTTLSVATILQTVSNNFNPTTGLFYGGDQTKTSEANNVLDAINSSGENPGGSSVVTVVNLDDSATLSGGLNEGGTITFYLFAPGVTPNSNDSNNVYSDTVTVSGNGNYNTTTGTNAGGYMPTATGTYQWVAVYSGDAKNNSVTSPFGSEPWTVGQSSPTITTIPGGSVVIGSGTNLTDTATLSDATSNAGGTITFYLLAPGSTSSTPLSSAVYTDKVTVTGNGNYSTATGNNPGGYLPTQTGTYEWVAVYSGDSNNSSASSVFGDEPEVVSPNTPSITTTPGGSVVIDSGNPLTDSATLSGGTNPTGTITFYLFAPGATASTPLSSATYTDVVTISGDGTYDTSMGNNAGGYLPTIAGTWEWVAVYSGDSNNASVASTFGDEAETATASSGAVASGSFATIGFWHNKNGQAVINSFNGGSTQTELGTWLATNFPNLFGKSNPYISGALSQFGATSLKGLTNAQVATVYEDLWNPSGVTKNTYVQAFAVALGMYADDPNLGYDSTAAQYGFQSITGGGQSLSYNVGSNGAAFGVANNTSLTVFQIMQAADAAFDASLGTFFNGDANQQTLTSDLNNVLNGINTQGDIS